MSQINFFPKWGKLGRLTAWACVWISKRSTKDSPAVTIPISESRATISKSEEDMIESDRVLQNEKMMEFFSAVKMIEIST